MERVLRIGVSTRGNRVVGRTGEAFPHNNDRLQGLENGENEEDDSAGFAERGPGGRGARVGARRVVDAYHAQDDADEERRAEEPAAAYELDWQKIDRFGAGDYFSARKLVLWRKKFVGRRTGREPGCTLSIAMQRTPLQTGFHPR